MTADRDDGTSNDRGVVRTCIGCRTRRESADLVRCTLRDGAVTVDGPSDGRGAWLCRVSLESCARGAIGGGAFGRAWRTKVDDALASQIEQRVAQAARTAVDDEEAAGPR